MCLPVSSIQTINRHIAPPFPKGVLREVLV